VPAGDAVAVGTEACTEAEALPVPVPVAGVAGCCDGAADDAPEDTGGAAADAGGAAAVGWCRGALAVAGGTVTTAGVPAIATAAAVPAVLSGLAAGCWGGPPNAGPGDSAPRAR
jgi:hypothetical protein